MRRYALPFRNQTDVPKSLGFQPRKITFNRLDTTYFDHCTTNDNDRKQVGSVVTAANGAIGDDTFLRVIVGNYIAEESPKMGKPTTSKPITYYPEKDSVVALDIGMIRRITYGPVLFSPKVQWIRHHALLAMQSIHRSVHNEV